MERIPYRLLMFLNGVFKRILFNLYVFFVGFRFYKIVLSNKEELFNEVTLNFNYGQPWVFKFYRTNVEYHEYRWGRFRDFKRIRYSIGTNFTEEHQELKDRYNDWLMSFYVPYSNLMPETSIIRYLLDNFVKHIVYEIQISKDRQYLGGEDLAPKRRFNDH